MKTLYKTLLEKLTDANAKAIFHKHNTKEIALIDEYEGQYFSPENYELLNCPFVLIELDIEYTNDKRPGQLTLTLHLGFEQIKRANNRTIDIDKNLGFYDFNDAVHEILSNIETDFTGKLELKNEASLKEPAITKVHNLTYACSYTRRSIDYNNKFDEVSGEEVSFSPRISVNPFLGNI